MKFLNMLNRLRRALRKTAKPFIQEILGDIGMVGVDVGGAKGLQPHWWTFHGSVNFYLFEPHQESFEELKKIFESTEFPEMYKVIPDALSGTGGPRILYKLNAPTGSSLLPIDMESDLVQMDDPYIFPIQEEQIETRTLREVMVEKQESRIDMIKLDVQGTELEILKGLGDELLDKVLLIELEVGFKNIYLGMPTFSDVETFMQKHGFRLFDVSVARVHCGKGGDPNWYQENVFGVYGNSPKISARLREFDVVYFKDPKSMIAKKDKDGVRRLIVCYCAYNFFSEAYSLVEECEAAGVFSRESSWDLKRALFSWHRALHYRFYHKPSWFFNQVRSVKRRFRIGRGSTWKQYMWFDYPNG